MKILKTSFILFVLSYLLIVSSCNKETIVNNFGMVSQYELDKSIVQINTTNVATGFNNIFNTMISDSIGRAHFCQAFVNDALFLMMNRVIFLLKL